MGTFQTQMTNHVLLSNDKSCFTYKWQIMVYLQILKLNETTKSDHNCQDGFVDLIMGVWCI